MVPIAYTNLWIHDALLFEPAKIHVHGVNFAPQVAVVLTVISSSQVAKAGRHVGAFRGKTTFY